MRVERLFHAHRISVNSIWYGGVGGEGLKTKKKRWDTFFFGIFVWKTSQELRMLSSVTLNCQATKIVINSVFKL